MAIAISDASEAPTVALDARLVGGTSTGDSTYWTGLLHGLARVERPFRICLLGNVPRPPEIPACFEWRHVSARSGRWWSLVSFPLAARRLGARAIHAQYTLSPLVGDRGITTIHDVSFLLNPEWFPPKHRLLLTRAVPASVRRARRVITVSETSRREIEERIPAARGKTVVTFNACPPWIRAVPGEEAKATVRRELGIEGPFLLTVGTRWPRKNMALAVEATALLPAGSRRTLVVTGKPGWGEERFGGHVRAVGYVSNEILSNLYSAADLYLAPSRHEGFGIPLLEAFRCGCPVLCSVGGALPEVAGEAASVMPLWDARAWSSAIGALLTAPTRLEDMRQKGRAREREFTWEETARRTMAIYG